MHADRKILIVALIVLAAVSGALALDSSSIALAQGPKPKAPGAPGFFSGMGFTYQGQLKNSGALVTGNCDFQFGLWDASTLGAQVGTTQTVSALSVTNGLFTAQLNDSGQIVSGAAFNGDARWLAEAVRCPSGGGSYTSLNPRQALTPAPMAFALPGLYTQQNATSPNVIGGYSGNVITPTLYGATIGGGGSTGVPNRVWDLFGTIAGGYGNTASSYAATVGGGALNTASGNYADIAGGENNTSSGYDATISGGGSNNASGDDTTISGGYFNTASARFSTVPGGNAALASHYGEMAYASGEFSNRGDGQTSTYVLTRATIDTTATEIFLDGIWASQRLTIAPARTLVFDILVVGRRNSNGDSAGYRFVGVIENVGGTTAIIGSVAKTVLAEDDATWDAAVSADNTNDSLKITVTGPSGTVRWVAVVHSVEVAN